MASKICPVCSKEFGHSFKPSRLKIQMNCSYKCAQKFVWNKGLTKETNESVKKASMSMKKGYKEGRRPWHADSHGLIKPNKGSFKKGHKPWNTNKPRDEKTKGKISEKVKKAWQDKRLIGSSHIRKGKKDFKLSQTRKRLFQEGKLTTIFKKGNTFWNNPKTISHRFQPIYKSWKDKKLLLYNRRVFNKRLKKQILKRDNHTCQRCGINKEQTKKELHIHHLDKNKFNNSPDNLISLCNKCHGRVHIKDRNMKRKV